MAKLASLQDLTRIREEIRRTLHLQTYAGTTIRIGMGTCGIAAGARETLETLQTLLNRCRMEVTLSTVGCIGLCSKEPLVEIQQGGKASILYANMEPQMVERLVEEHLLRGRPVREWVICRMPLRGE